MSANPPPARVDPFANLDDLGDFKAAAVAKPKPASDVVRQVSEANNFPSRAPAPRSKAAVAAEPRTAQRRHRTGRNVQFNIKATAETIERFTKLSDAKGWVFGETLARALDALEADLKAK